MEKILIVCAHPDDEILGCAGTIARLVKEGARAYTLILGEGVTSRENWTAEELKNLHSEATEANRIIGVELPIFIDDFPDNRFDSVPLLEITKAVEKVIDAIKPDTIFTHFRNDLNIDHRITYQAVLTATRPIGDHHVKKVNEIYSFEVLSSTEWNYPTTFSPNVFYDIYGTMAHKMAAMGAYKSELREHPHPRSQSGINYNAALWGMKAGMRLAEAFEVVRILR